MSFIETLRDAQLRPAEVARLLKISRVTASLWINGHSKPHTLLKTRVEKLDAALTAIIREGKLPFDGYTSSAERRSLLETWVNDQLTQQGGSSIEEDLQ